MFQQNKTKTRIKNNIAMKNTITTFICAMALGTTLVFANTEDKTSVNSTSALPAYVTATETPAPQKVKPAANYNKYTPAQKASLVGLKLTKVTK